MPKIYLLQQGTGPQGMLCYIDYEIGDNSITINDTGGLTNDGYTRSSSNTTVYVNINENIHQFSPKANGINGYITFSSPEVSWENEPIIQNNVSDTINITITFSTEHNSSIKNSVFSTNIDVGISNFIYVSQNGGDFVKRKMYVSINGGSFKEVTKDKFKIIGE